MFRHTRTDMVTLIGALLQLFLVNVPKNYWEGDLLLLVY